MHKYRRKQRALPPLLSTLFVKQLTGVCEMEALICSGGVAVELQPQAIWCAVNDLAQHVVTCVVAKETGRGVLSIINLTVKNTASGEQSMVNRGFSRLEESGLLRTLTRTSKQVRGTKRHRKMTKIMEKRASPLTHRTTESVKRAVRMRKNFDTRLYSESSVNNL